LSTKKFNPFFVMRRQRAGFFYTKISKNQRRISHAQRLFHEQPYLRLPAFASGIQRIRLSVPLPQQQVRHLLSQLPDHRYSLQYLKAFGQ